MSKAKCPWCGEQISVEEWSRHIDSHKDPVYDRKLIEESRNKHAPSPPDMDSEMVKFIQCVAEKLTPLPKPGEYPSGPDGYIARFLNQRVNYEHGLYAVLLGEKTLQEFFKDAKQRWDINESKLSQAFRDCLKGLCNKEARELAKQWEMYLELL